MEGEVDLVRRFRSPRKWILNGWSGKTSLRKWFLSQAMKEGENQVMWGRAFQAVGIACTKALR